MRTIILIPIVVVFIWSQAWAQPGIVAQFEVRSHTFQGTTIPYRLFVPDGYDSTVQYPLVLALHGSGERGDDNLSQVANYRLATVWADPANQVKYPCFVVAPQCPYSGSWTRGFYPAPLGAEMTTVVDILDSLVIEFSIDENRQYVTGLSMGGYGTWDLITRFPDRFAAAIPMSAGYDPSLVDRILHIPIWNFHGALDDAVNVAGSRVMMEAFEARGRRVLYTHCHVQDCRGIPDSLMDMYVESHADLFYTEYADGGHIIWDESYDDPNLVPWVFDQYRRQPDGIEWTNLESYWTLQGVEIIRWNSTHQGDSVELWYSPDDGETWQLVSASEPDNGLYVWNTEAFDDCAFGLMKIFSKGSSGFIFGTYQSRHFKIDNDTNGTPFVKIVNDEFWRGDMLAQDMFDLELLIGDAESEPLTVTVLLSLNGGQLFFAFDTFVAVTDSAPQVRSIDLGNLPNSSQSVIRVDVTDGVNSFTDETNTFVKETPRQPGPDVHHVAGKGGAIVMVNVVDEDQLNGHLYRITFAQTTCCPSLKVYGVLDVDAGMWVVEGATEMDGVAEGPLFDGLRLVIQDFDPAVVDIEQTGWSTGASNLEISIYLPVINLGTEVLRGIPYPADYVITLTDHVADTSSTAYGSPAVPMCFDVWNITDERGTDVIFIDNDHNQTLSRLDELFLLLPYGELPQLTWAFLFSGSPSARNPQPGDIFQLKTRKPIGVDDVFEFRAISTSPQKGDVNHDAAIDVLDVLMAVDIALQTIGPAAEELWSTDCNGIYGDCGGDGAVNALDIVKLVRIALGLERCSSHRVERAASLE